MARFEERHWSPVNTPVFDKDGKTITCIIHHVHDVTEFVHLRQSELALGRHVVYADQKLRESEERLQESASRLAEFEGRIRAEDALADARRRLDAALEGGQIATWVWDIRADRLYGDRNMTAFFNLPPDEGGGVPLSAYAVAVHPDDRDRVMSLLESSIPKRP